MANECRGCAGIVIVAARAVSSMVEYQNGMTIDRVKPSDSIYEKEISVWVISVSKVFNRANHSQSSIFSFE